MAQGQRTAMVRDPVLDVVEPSLKVGASCGCIGFLAGGTAGILRNTTPFLFATASGIQTAALGTSFWASRGAILQAWTSADTHRPSDLTKASMLAGGLSGGAVALLFRGRANVLPATLMWSLFGFAGQVAANGYTLSAEQRREQPKESFWRRMADKSWSPMKFMSNEEYATILREKMLKVDVEIAILEDKIEALKQQQRDDRNARPVSPESNEDARTTTTP